MCIHIRASGIHEAEILENRKQQRRSKKYILLLNWRSRLLEKGTLRIVLLLTSGLSHHILKQPFESCLCLQGISQPASVLTNHFSTLVQAKLHVRTNVSSPCYVLTISPLLTTNYSPNQRWFWITTACHSRCKCRTTSLILKPLATTTSDPVAS